MFIVQDTYHYPFRWKVTSDIPGHLSDNAWHNYFEHRAEAYQEAEKRNRRQLTEAKSGAN